MSTPAAGGGAAAGSATARRIDRGELAFAGVLLAVGVFVLVDTATIEIPKAASNVGPRFFPYAVAALLVGAAGAVVLAILRGDHASPEEGSWSTRPCRPTCAGWRWWSARWPASACSSTHSATRWPPH